MNTTEQKQAKIAKLKRLGRDVTRFEAKLRLADAPIEEAATVEGQEEAVKPVRRGRRPRNG